MLPPMDDLVMSTLEQAIKEFHGDAQHIYLTGLSMGGFGAWHLGDRVKIAGEVKLYLQGTINI